MAVIYNAATRTNRMTQVLNAIDGGPAAGTLEIGTAGFASVLVSCTLSDPCGTVSGDVLTFSTITDGTATATGTAAEARIKDSTGTVVVSGLTVSTSGANVNLSSTSIATNDTVSITSATLTHNTSGT